VAGAVTLSTVVAVGFAVSVVLGVVVTGGGLGAVGGGTSLVLVLSPSLGTPAVTVLVVPLIVGFSIVGLGPCLLVGLIDFEVLVSAPGIPVRSVLSVLGSGSLLGGGIDGTLGTVTVATVTVSVLLGPDAGGLAVSVDITRVVVVVILSPLIIISLEPSGVLLVLVRASLHGIVRLAPP